VNLQHTQDHAAAVDALLQRVQADPVLKDLAQEIAAILRYESVHGVPEIDWLLTRLRAVATPTATRIAIISDIHGNHAGLMAAFADIEAQGCDRIICLGDLVEGGPGNEEVVACLRERRIPCVRGNHDEINDATLAGDTRRFLNGLPESIVEHDVLFIHISPRDKKRKIDHGVEAWNVFEESAHRRTFVGHAHVPHIFGERSRTYGEATRHAFEYNRPFQLERDDRYIVGVGSIGYGRDAVARIRYCIFDHAADTVEMRAIDGPLLALDYSMASFS
jgi:predicted phosphodiesterase